MSKKMILIASALLIIGLVLFVVTMACVGWDFTKLGTVTFESSTHTVTEDFNSVSIDTDTADITFALSSDGSCRVECYEDSKIKHFVCVENGTLKIQSNNEKKWYDYIGFSFKSSKILSTFFIIDEVLLFSQ